MKIYAFLFLALAMTSVSCSKIYYQYHTITPENQMLTTDDFIVYEDENCVVSYNFMNRECGDASFVLYNKTEINIQVNLDECFFVLNGMAYDYYQNKVLTTFESLTAGVAKTRSKSASATFIPYWDYRILASVGVSEERNVSASNTTGSAVSYSQEKTILIPPKAAKKIMGYAVNEKIFDTKSSSFLKEASPIVFENHISYQVGRESQPQSVINKFYVSEITQLREREVLETISYNPNTLVEIKDYKDKRPNRFFIKYEVSQW